MNNLYQILNYDKIDCNNDLITKAPIFSVFSITMEHWNKDNNKKSDVVDILIWRTSFAYDYKN